MLAAACFLCFFTLLVLLVEVVLLLVVEEAAGVCARAVPIIRERPTKADAMSFMVVLILFILEAVLSVFQYERRSLPLTRHERVIKVSKRS